jgi:hypothetical protein
VTGRVPSGRVDLEPCWFFGEESDGRPGPPLAIRQPRYSHGIAGWGWCRNDWIDAVFFNISFFGNHSPKNAQQVLHFLKHHAFGANTGE